MLMHEWIKYRNAQIKRAVEPADAPPTPDDSRPPGEEAAKAPEAQPAAEAPESAPPAPADEPAPAPPPERAPTRAQAPPSDAESTDREKEALLDSLQQEMDRTGRSVRGRLEALHARQRQLPIDLDEERAEDEGPRAATETREDLVHRLLDPTLTLREAALLLDVCPTTVRRYTNRGLLNCYRTPGNQRRFRLSDVIEFMERRERDGR